MEEARTRWDELKRLMRSLSRGDENEPAAAPPPPTPTPAGDQRCAYCRDVVREHQVWWRRARPYCQAHQDADVPVGDQMCRGSFCWKAVCELEVWWRGDRAFCPEHRAFNDLPAGPQACGRCAASVPEHAVRWRYFRHDLRAYCRACVDRQCTRCDRLTACPPEIWDCAVCRRPVCFFNRDHSVRVDRTTCCLECVRALVDVRGRVVALLEHLPAGIVRAVAGVAERSVGTYELALRRTASQWPRCTGCGERVPSIPRVSLECDRCGRATKSQKPRCEGCRAWRCRECRGGTFIVKVKK